LVNSSVFSGPRKQRSLQPGHEIPRVTQLVVEDAAHEHVIERFGQTSFEHVPALKPYAREFGASVSYQLL
jgi:hypothetical protein